MRRLLERVDADGAGVRAGSDYGFLVSITYLSTVAEWFLHIFTIAIQEIRMLGYSYYTHNYNRIR